MSGDGRARAPRIVLTGGPGGGKTTAAELFRREIGPAVVVVPEAATMLFAGGFPRVDEPDARGHVQRAIYEVQRNLEEVQQARYPDRVLLCDRGTVDGAVYWPEGPDAFFTAMGTTRQAELARYDAVLFFETAAAGGHDIEGGNPTRTEGAAAAVDLDRRLRHVYAAHPRFWLIHNERSFFAKIGAAFGLLSALVAGGPTPGPPGTST